MEKIESYRIMPTKVNYGELTPKPAATPRRREKVPEGTRDEQVAQSIDFNEVVNNVNEFIHTLKTNLSFRYDEERQSTIITVKNEETGEVIRQIPPEEMIRLARTMKAMVGIIFNQEA